MPTSTALWNCWGRCMTSSNERLGEALARAHAARRWAYFLIAGIFIAGIAIVAVTAFALTRSVLLPLRALEAGANRFGGGDLSHRVELNKSDELGQLAQTFNAMAEKIEQHEATLEKRASQLNALNQIAVAITSSLSLQNILDEIMRRGIALTGAKASCIAFYDEATALFTQWITHGLSEHFVKNIAFRPGGLADEAFTTASYILSNDRSETKHKLSKLAHEEGLQCFVCLPLTSRNRHLGWSTSTAPTATRSRRPKSSCSPPLRRLRRRRSRTRACMPRCRSRRERTH